MANNKSEASPRSLVAMPALYLTVCAVLCLIALAIELYFDISIVMGSLNHRSRVYTSAQTRIAYVFFMGLFNVWIIRGAWEMIRLRSYSAARSSAIISCVPCVGPCFVFGLPFGIWALVRLNDPRVKQAFTQLK